MNTMCTDFPQFCISRDIPFIRKCMKVLLKSGVISSLLPHLTWDRQALSAEDYCPLHQCCGAVGCSFKWQCCKHFTNKAARQTMLALISSPGRDMHIRADYWIRDSSKWKVGSGSAMLTSMVSILYWANSTNDIPRSLVTHMNTTNVLCWITTQHCFILHYTTLLHLILLPVSILLPVCQNCEGVGWEDTAAMHDIEVEQRRWPMQ